MTDDAAKAIIKSVVGIDPDEHPHALGVARDLARALGQAVDTLEGWSCTDEACTNPDHFGLWA